MKIFNYLFNRKKKNCCTVKIEELNNDKETCCDPSVESTKSNGCNEVNEKSTCC